MDAYNIATQTIPFVWDVISKPWEVDLCGEQEDGLLTSGCRAKIPPVAAATISPTPVYVGYTVTFDASGSADEYDAVSDLSVRWDFDGDGTFDTDWDTNKQATYTFYNTGAYTARLKIMDTDGLVGAIIIGVNVKPVGTQGLARHIKVFRDILPWESNAFETVMASLGYTEGTGSKQYEILSSSEMATNIILPGQDLVVIMNDQDQDYYNNISASYERIERFLANGGAMLWEACDEGWNTGSMASAGLSLPKGVTYTFNLDETNYNVLSGSTLMSGLPETLTGNYASHEYFTNLPSDAVVYMEDTYGHATMFEYSPFGLGSVIVTGNPLEWGYDSVDSYTIGLVYPNLFTYILGDDTATLSNQAIAYKLKKIKSYDKEKGSSAGKK